MVGKGRVHVTPSFHNEFFCMLFHASSFPVIGMIHFSPLEESQGYPGYQVILERARDDLDALLKGGVDAVLFENNFDTPKFEKLPKANAKQFEELVKTLSSSLTVPWGISPLWNDYGLGFRLCKKYGGKMVRVPVFTDSVETVYGIFEADPDAVLRAREEEQAQEVEIWADVQVKHARMLQPRPFKESVEDTVGRGVEAVIVTGQWTGDPPSVEQCREAYGVVGHRAAVFTGSGMTAENISSFRPFLNGCIVGTAFKEDAVKTDRQGPNIVGPEVRYDLEKICRFVASAHEKSPS